MRGARRGTAAESDREIFHEMKGMGSTVQGRGGLTQTDPGSVSGSWMVGLETFLCLTWKRANHPPRTGMGNGFVDVSGFAHICGGSDDKIKSPSFPCERHW